jgi:hypothetical protein
MACSTCGYAMYLVGSEGIATRRFWCEQCGTLKVERPTQEEVRMPKLVERCREFGVKALDADHDPSAVDYWYMLGIGESIGPPVDRPPTT